MRGCAGLVSAVWSDGGLESVEEGGASSCIDKVCRGCGSKL